MIPPIFVVFDNGEVDAFETAEIAEAYFCDFDDIEPEGGRVWDATGLRLEVSRVGHRAHFADSRLPLDGAQLRRLLVGALDRANRPPSKDATLDEIAAIAYEAFRLRADAKPLLVVLVLIAALAGIAVGTCLLLVT